MMTDYTTITYESYLSCRRRKRQTKGEQMFSLGLVNNLLELKNALRYGTYQPLPMKSFLIHDPVVREIFAPSFRDRTEQQIITTWIDHLMDGTLIHDCYACRKKRGTLFGIKRLKRFIAQCTANYHKDCWVLLGDLKGYFMSIDRKNLWKKWETFIRTHCEEDRQTILLYSMHNFIFSSPLEKVIILGDRKAWKELPRDKSLFCASGTYKPDEYDGDYTASMGTEGKGLAIGTPPAHLSGNYFLNDFDHYCKHTLGLRFYGRYVDDFFIVHENKDHLKNLVPLLRSFLRKEGLTLHPHKIRLFHYTQGFKFLGAWFKGAAVMPGRRTIGRFRNLLEEICALPDEMATNRDIERYTARLNSYMGSFRHTMARKLFRELLQSHPRVNIFFECREEKKFVSRRHILESRQRTAAKIARRLWHRQFEKRNRRGPWQDRETLYRQAYFQLYRTPPPLSYPETTRWDETAFTE